MSIIVVDAVLPIGGTGVFTITDTTAAAIALQTGALEKLFGTTASLTGGLTGIVSGQAKSIENMDKKLSTLVDKFSSLETAVVNINKGQADILTALANMQFVLIETKTIQTMAFIDQADNNQFQQKATNQALVDAGKPPIKVEPAEFEASTKKTIVAIGTINSQVAATNIIQEYVTGALTKGFAISQQWIAQTAFGKFVTDYYAVGKLKTQLIYADEKAKLKIQDEINAIYQRRTNPTAPPL
jgi:uncharacterized coiled-coil protein SlyX